MGNNARELISKSVSNIASNLGVKPEEIIFTSGASESNNLVIKGICERYKNKGKHVLISSLEHNSILSSAMVMQEMGFEVELIPINSNGLIDIDALKNIKKSESWIKNALENEDILLSEIFYAFYKNKKLYIIKKGS